MGILDRMKNAWNAFSDTTDQDIFNKSPFHNDNITYGSWYPQFRYHQYSKGSIIDTIITRIAMDVSMVEFKHVRIDYNPDSEVNIDDGLNRCLTLEANIDQSAQDFIQDAIFSMFDEGVVALVPIDTDVNPYDGSYDIVTLRTGRIVQWYPQHVRVNVYDDRTGLFKEILVEKSKCAILQNPLYSIVNADNATFKRLIRKLQLMDKMDEDIANNKLDMIIKLPFVTKDEIRQKRATERVSQIQKELTDNRYGIAYIDANEEITQLGRSVENNLLKEIEYLQTELYNQLGLTQNVFNGTAKEEELRSYYDRTINPIAKALAKELERKFLTQTARTQGHRIVYYTDPFKLVPLSQFATMADTFRRNEILTTNEIRELIGFQPSDEDRANTLFNPNIADSNQMGAMMEGGQVDDAAAAEAANTDFASLIGQLSDDQVDALMDKCRELLGDDSVPDDQVFDNLTDEQIMQLVDYINNELIGQEGEEESQNG